jgi:hypothetical protein
MCRIDYGRGRDRGSVDSGRVRDGFCNFHGLSLADLAVAGAAVIHILASPIMDCGVALLIYFSQLIDF